MLETLIFVFVFFASLAGVEIFRRWSLRRNLLDIPNERSSHIRPTPRGGGLIIVLASLIVYAFYTTFISQNFSWSYFCGSILIAFVSWLDDLFSVSVVFRILVHSISAILVIYSLGYFQTFQIAYIERANLGTYGVILTFLWIVWLTNAFNFMDGIDGIAATQAITSGLGWLIIGKILDLDATSFYGGVIAFASLGFLIHNWYPAKIFMGDVGSAFLGYTFAVFPLLAIKENPHFAASLPLVSILLVWLFVFDTFVTFFRRVIKREKVWKAHRTHIYQRLVIAGHTHVNVTILYGAVSLATILILIISYKSGDLKMLLPIIVILEGLGLYILLRFSEIRKNIC